VTGIRTNSPPMPAKDEREATMRREMEAAK
jgi:hypothetical protein